MNFLRKLFRILLFKKPTPFIYWTPVEEFEELPDEGPTKCPRCASRIDWFEDAKIVRNASERELDVLKVEGFHRLHSLDGEQPAMLMVQMSSTARGDEESNRGSYVCMGLADREEVEEYLTDEYPSRSVPEEVQHKDPCGWFGKTADYGKMWR